MASVTYYTAAGQTSWSSAEPVGLPVWEQPFPERSEKLLFRQRFWQKAEDWAPVALNTTYAYHGQYGVPTSSSYYLAAEENFADERGGVLSWDRVYATVPSARTDFVVLPAQFPAIAPAFSIGASTSIGVTQFGQAGADKMYINYAGAAPGDRLVLSYTLTIGAATFATGSRVYVRDYAPNGIIVDLDPNFLSTSATARTVARGTFTTGRQFPLDANARVWVQYTYTLCAAGAAPSVAFNSRQKFTKNGEEVNFVAGDTSPTSASYLAWITAGTTYRIEDDGWARWVGNIFEVRTTAVVAQ